jgi:hypothetical protein
MSKPKPAITSPALEIEADADSPQRWTAKRQGGGLLEFNRPCVQQEL